MGGAASDHVGVAAALQVCEHELILAVSSVDETIINAEKTHSSGSQQGQNSLDVLMPDIEGIFLWLREKSLM